MPITLPNLDDRRFDDLVAEARALIPALAPQWTDHNPSDPGITLVELFAYLSEILIYRLNRVTDANTRAFLKLINGPPWQPSADDLEGDIRYTIQALRRPDRAVAPADFEFLARAAHTGVARATCVARRNLDRSLPGNDPDADAPGHVSVVVLPASGTAGDVLAAVAAYLEPRRLLTTRLHVVPPRSVRIGVQLSLWLEADARADDVRERATEALKTYLHPLRGGADGSGWPFGRPVFVSEIYRVLDTVSGVDYVEPSPGVPELVYADDPRNPRRLNNSQGQLIGVRLSPDELVDITIDPLVLTPTRRKRSPGP